jgi:hypothetical protein
VSASADGHRELLAVSAFTRAARGKREELKAAPGALIETMTETIKPSARTAGGTPLD